jgi:hypothetical protein
MKIEKAVRIQCVYEHDAELIRRATETMCDERLLNAGTAETLDTVGSRDEDQHAVRIRRAESGDIRRDRCAVGTEARMCMCLEARTAIAACLNECGTTGAIVMRKLESHQDSSTRSAAA